MSVFELGGDDRRALLESARLNISSQQEPEYTEAEKTATGAAMGTMRALAESGRTALKLAGAAPVVYDAAKSAITGEYTTSAQDAFFKTFVGDVGKGAIEYWTPQAEHTNKAGDIIGGVVGGLAQFAATGFNPFLFGAEAGLNTQGALTDQGVDLGTSSAVGGVAAVASAAGAFLPPSVGGTFIKKLASGAAINLALGTAERGIDGAILQGEGYNKAAEQYSWKDSTSAAIDAFMGAAFGVMPSSMPAPKLKEVQDSVLTVASGKHAALDVAPGDPATPASAAIHHNALSAAIKQIVEGEPVNVGDKINKAEFSLRDELPSVKQLRGDLTDLLTEDGRNQFAQQLLDHQGPEGAYKTHEEARFVVDQFGAGIQKLHGAGVPMERLSQLRTSFGKPAEDGAVFNQNPPIDETPAIHVPEDLEMTPEMEALFREHGVDIPAASDSVKSTPAGVDENGYRITSDADRSDYIQQFKTGPSTSESGRAGVGDGGNSQLPDGRKKAKLYSEGSQLLTKVRERSHDITNELKGSPENARRNADATLGPFKGYGVNAKVVGERLHIKYYSEAQKKAGLDDEPALTVILNKTGELVINGPAADSPTFAEFQKRGWADFATKGDGTKSEFWTKLTNPDKSLATESMHNVLADAHARLRAWRKEDKVGINWQRYTGATGDAQTGKKGVAYFQKGGDAFARNVKGDTESPQGQINFGIDSEKLNATISLFETANKSTALHELSHNFLEIYKHLNQFDDTPASIKEDYAEMRRLIGADDAGSPLTKDHHERFAEAFEQYTREGKAPTPALKRAFEHFKEWMTAIYQRAADLGAPINDDVRAMFDKMLGKEMPVEHFDPLLKNKDVQNELRRQAQNAGWAEVGGKVIMDENRVVTGRTSWIPKEEWYTAGMGPQADVERAVGKAIRGEKLSKKQQSIVAAMLDSPAHDAAREDMQLNAAMSKTTEGETPEQKAARMAEMDAFFDSIPEAAGVSDILKSADDLLIPQDDGSTVSARQLMESLHTELQESDAMPKVYDAAINCFLRG